MEEKIDLKREKSTQALSIEWSNNFSLNTQGDFED